MDLTTLFEAYVANLRDASALALLDNDTLIELDWATVLGAVTQDDDRNTAYAIYLS